MVGDVLRENPRVSCILVASQAGRIGIESDENAVARGGAPSAGWYILPSGLTAPGATIHPPSPRTSIPSGKDPLPISASAIRTLFEVVMSSSARGEGCRMSLQISVSGHQRVEGTNTISASMSVRIDNNEISPAEFNAWYGVGELVEPPLLDLFAVRSGQGLPIPNERFLAPTISVRTDLCGKNRNASLSERLGDCEVLGGVQRRSGTIAGRQVPARCARRRYGEFGTRIHCCRHP